METIYLIRGSIGKFIKSFDMVIKAVLKVLAYYLLFHYVSNIEGFTGSGMLNSLPAHLILAVVSMLLPNRCGILLAILLGIFNISQVTMLGAIIAAVFFLVLYIMTSRLFPDHVYMLALVPVFLHFKMYLLLPLIAGMYMGIVALIPMICGAIMAIMLTLIPEFMNLQMPANLDELPQILSDIFKYGFNQILHNEELVFVAIVFTGVVILVHLLRKMEINYGSYIALIAGTVLGLVCLFMGKMTFGISDSYIGVILRSLLALLITAIIEFMHSALDYQSTQKLSFEDDEYQYYVTVIPKIAVSKPKREVKTITEAAPKIAEEAPAANKLPERRKEMAAGEKRPAEQKPVQQRPVQQRPAEQRPVQQQPVPQRPVETPTVSYQPVDAAKHPSKESPVKHHEIPGMPLEEIQIQKPTVRTETPKAAVNQQKPLPQKPVVHQEAKPEVSAAELTKNVEIKKTEVKKPVEKEETLASFFEED